MKTIPVLRSIFAVLFSIAFAQMGWGQGFTEGLNNSVTNVTVSGGAYFTGNSGTGDRPASSPFAVEGTHSRGVTNGTATITSNSINTTGGSSVALTFRLAAFSFGSTTNGLDTGDTVIVAVSPDGGTTYYNTLTVQGNGNAYWAYSATGVASTPYDGNTTSVAFQTGGGGSRTTDGYSTVAVTNLPAVAAMRFRITMLNDSAAERWVADNIVLSGTFGSPPTVTTGTSGAVTNSSALVSGNNVTADGGLTITERGVVFGTSANPTTANGKATTSGTTGSYNTSLTGLLGGTFYHARAFAINSAGTSYGSGITFTTEPAVLPSVTTGTAGSITGGGATISGNNVTSDGAATITERGIVYATTPNPTTANSKLVVAGTTGAFDGNLVGLSPETPFYARAFATNSVGTTYGDEVTFTTLAISAPTVVTGTAGSIATTTATISTNNVTSDGGSPITERGVVYSTTVFPTTASTKLTSAGTTGTFNSSLTGLTAGTVYYLRAYAINAAGTSYGAQIGFATTFAGVTRTFQEGVSTYAGTDDTFVDGTATTANNGAVTSLNIDSASPVAQALIRFNNIIGSGGTQIPSGSTVTAASLRIYVTNVGDNVNVHRMLANWTEASTWTTLSGGVTANDTEAGITILGNYTGVSSQNANYTVTGLQSAVQAWVGGATNNGFVLLPTGSNGIDFDSSEGATPAQRPLLSVTYTPPSPTVILPPTVVTGTSGSLTPSGAAISANNVTSAGGGTITERGVVFSTSQNPTTASSKVAVAGTTGAFDASLTGLSANTLYYARAFATNSAGTDYGSQTSFTTTMAGGTITVGGSLTARSSTYGTASTAASFTVSGTGLTGDLTVTPPAGFETSLTEGSGDGATTVITASGTLASTTVYVRLAAATTPGNYSGNITVSGGGASSETLAIPSSTVSAKELTLTGAAVTTKAYDTTTAAAITGSLSGIVAPDVVTFTGTGTFAQSDVGTGISVTAAIVLTGADAAKYAILQPTGLTGEITKANQTITFAALPSKLTTDAAFALTATASSGLPVSYNSANTSVATISGSTLTIVGVAGSSVITASQTGDANYNAAPSVQQTQTVTTGPTVLTAGDIAVLALQTDDADQFAFVTLVDLNPTTQVSFTDNAWTGSAINTGENTIIWQVPAAGLTAGTVVTFTNGSGFSTGTTVSGSYSGASTSGDQLIVYQGIPGSPTFIYAFSSNAWITTGTVTSNNSYLPTGLTNGTTARDFTTEEDNSFYGHPATFGANKTAFLAAIGSSANWQRDADRVTQLPAWSFITPASDLVLSTRLAKLATWKYLDTGVDPGTTWRNAGFDDSTWSSGAAPLGAGDAHIATTVNIGASGSRHTVYFRNTFTIPDATAVQHLRLNVLRDDGVVVYVNGTEVARDNMATGTVVHNQTTPNNTESAAESAYWTSNALPLSALVSGTNTIAVQVHNRSLTSSDLGFDLEIVEYATPPTPVAASGQFDFAPHDGAATSFAHNGTAIPNVTVSAMTYVGVTPGNNDPNLQGQWPNTGTLNLSGAANAALAGSPNAGAYFEFTLTADAGYILSNPKLRFNVGRELNGPRQFQWRSSVDGFVSPITATRAIDGSDIEIFSNEFRALDQNFFGPDAITSTNYNEVSLTTANRSSVTFRFYAYGMEATNTGARLTRFLNFLLDVTPSPTAVPPAPLVTGIVANNNQLRIAFTPPAGSVTSYEYSIDGGTSWTPTSPAIPSSPLVINGLTNGQTYPIQLRALNANGTGDASPVQNGIPQPNTIVNLNSTDTRTLNGGSYALGAFATSGLPVSFESSNTGVATVSGSTLTIVGPGTTTITASQPGNGDFAAAPNVTQTLTVLPAGWNLIENFESSTLGNLDFQNNWSVGIGTAGGNGTTTVTADPANAGNKVATLSGTHTAASRFMASLSPTETVTLFKRFRIENIDTSAVSSGESHLNMGVSTVPVPTGPGEFTAHTSVTPTVTTPFRLRHTPESAPTNVTVISDVWYSSWYVLNNSTQKFKLYIQGGSQSTPVLAADGTVTDGLWTYRNAGVITAARIYLRTLANHNAPAYIDDIYFAAGEVLNAPVAVPTIATGTAGSITRTTAVITGNDVATDGNAPITERGVVFSTSPNPSIDDIADTKVVVSGTTGTFNASLTGLVSGSPYYVRAFATNTIGTAYGSGITFTANAAPVFSGMSVSTMPATALQVIESKILARLADADGGPATITSVAANSAEGGTLSRSGGIITYTPALAFSGTDSFTVSVDDGFGAVNVTIQVTVAADPLFTSPANAPRLTDLGGGAKRIAFNGIPGRTYAIQRSTTMQEGSWEQIAAVIAAPDSTVTYDDPTPPQPSAFYRIAYPAQ